MDPSERHVAARLHGAPGEPGEPGEPPMPIDPDALLAHRPRRLLMPFVAGRSGRRRHRGLGPGLRDARSH